SVDTTGNFSPTNTVSFLYETAPASLNGLTGTVSPGGGIPFSVSFGSTTFSQVSTDTNNPSGVGTYSDTKLSPSTAQLKVIYTAPPLATNDNATVLLNFTGVNVAVFTDQSGANSGGISFALAPNVAPASVAGNKAFIVGSDSDEHTVAFRSGTFTDTNNTQGGTNSGSYSFTKYSPVAALLKLTGSNGSTNYVILAFSATNQGSFFDTDYHNAGNPPDTDNGLFALASQFPTGNAPSALQGLTAQVLLNGSAFTLSFGANTFSQSST